MIFSSRLNKSSVSILLLAVLCSLSFSQTPVNEWIWVEQTSPSLTLYNEHLVMVTVVSAQEYQKNP